MACTDMEQKTPAQLVNQLRELGVSGGAVLLVHCSFRAVRPVVGGPGGLIEALIEAVGPEGTLVMPTMTDGQTVFDPAVTPTSKMGVVAETFWQRPQVLRSTHPSGSFAAWGQHSEHICAPQPLTPPHGLDSPVGRVFELAGSVLLLGVHHSENTTVHLAESIAGVPYFIAHPCVVEQDGQPVRIHIAETDHCCEGFRRVEPWVQSIQRTGTVGRAVARLVPSQGLVHEVVRRLRVDLLQLLCKADAPCEECALARASLDGSDARA
jgi:aminoglycoside 3-N-acetyltransferase